MAANKFPKNRKTAFPAATQAALTPANAYPLALHSSWIAAQAIASSRLRREWFS
jgi:hypothetical protein